MAHSCFNEGCELKVEYVCLCLASETCSCEFHLGKHLNLPNRTHIFDSVLEEPSEWTKDEILKFLMKEKSVKLKLKWIVMTAFKQNAENRIKESLRNLKSDLKQISNLIEKISQASCQCPISYLLNEELGNEEEVEKAMFLQESEPYRSVKLFCILRQLRKKKSEILNRVNNDPEAEKDFDRACLLYKKYDFDPLIRQTLQELTNDYQRMASLYLIDKTKKNTTLLIYDTVSEKEEMKALNDWKTPNEFMFLTQLPAGELLFIGEVGLSTIFFIIDRDYKFRKLPPGMPFEHTSAVYFNRSVYFFGGKDKNTFLPSSTSNRFDLDENRWIHLAPMPKRDWSLNSTVFNGNIVISGYRKNYIFLYSIDIDSFSKISIDLATNTRKILLKAEERLYLIELNTYGSIYESEVRDEYSWKIIGKAMIGTEISQVYYSYNKGGFYISTYDTGNVRQYFKFDLSQKSLIDIAYYDSNLAFKKLDGKLEAIKGLGHTFYFNSNDTPAYINKKFPFHYLGRHLGIIECSNKTIELYPDYVEGYLEKGYSLYYLGRRHEAIECFNKVIEISPKNSMAYIWKGHSLYYLNKLGEAIECYSEAAKLNPKNIDSLVFKGYALRDLGQNIEAIDCYNKIIEIRPISQDAYIEKGEVLHDMSRNLEAIECYDLSNNIYPRSKALISKGHALIALSRYFEAMDCYNESIELDPTDFLFFFYRANLHNDMGQELEAIQDFNKAYEVMNSQRTYNQAAICERDEYFCDEELVREILELLKMISKLQESAVEFTKELQKLKDASLRYPEVYGEVEKKEITIKEKHSKLLKRAGECLNSIKSIEIIKNIENEVSEHQKEKNDIIAQSWLLLSMNQ